MIKRNLLPVLILWGVASMPGWCGPLADIEPLIPDAILDIRYHSSYNFVGEPIAGYLAPKCLLTAAAARALVAVAEDARQRGMAVKIFDCYRPQQAVDHFVRWAKGVDTRMKPTFYPKVNKSRLFADGYIAERSGHSRGSTLDLTLVVVSGADTGELEMGTAYDFFDPLSHTDNPAVSPRASVNRLLLKELMAAHGFSNLPEEWWHYTLENEPFPDTYFDTPIE